MNIDPQLLARLVHRDAPPYRNGKFTPETIATHAFLSGWATCQIAYTQALIGLTLLQFELCITSLSDAHTPLLWAAIRHAGAHATADYTILLHGLRADQVSLQEPTP